MIDNYLSSLRTFSPRNIFFESVINTGQQQTQPCDQQIVLQASWKEAKETSIHFILFIHTYSTITVQFRYPELGYLEPPSNRNQFPLDTSAIQ